MNTNEIVSQLHEQKGQLMAYSALFAAILRGMNQTNLLQTIAEFDTECNAAKTMLLNSSAPEAVLESFDRHAAVIATLWNSQSTSRGNTPL